MFDFEPGVDDYAVMGNPISHSKSPQIHHAFAEQTQQRIAYSAIQVDLGGFRQAVGNFFANGGKGLNITIPFKREAWDLVNKRSKRADAAGAVNTILTDDDQALYGDNTDGVGLVKDLIVNHKTTIKDRGILLVGAGGAARGVVMPLLTEQPAHLTIVNRTADKAYELADRFKLSGPVTGVNFDSIADKQYDLIINATSASLHGEVPPLPDSIFSENAMSYDMMYGAEETAFQRWSTRHGANICLDGLGMLVEQAAESFYLWRAVRPKTREVIELIRSEL